MTKLAATIRPFLEIDIESLGDLFFPWTTRDETIQKWTTYYEEQQNGIREIFIVDYQGKIAGYGSLLYESNYPNFLDHNIPEINDVWIFEPYRSNGFATHLINYMVDHAREAAYQSVGIGVGLYKDYGAAQRLYSYLGFNPDGNGITYKEELVVPGESYRVDDELILWLQKTIAIPSNPLK